MARLYADEQFPFEVVEHLCDLGHDVLTVQAAGNANLKIPDDRVLEFATINNRVVLTLNRKDFKRLHRSPWEHPNCAIGINTRRVMRLPAIDVCSFHDVFTNLLDRMLDPETFA
jgi:predicted nuclease of predicted toxin-antitoxin system